MTLPTTYDDLIDALVDTVADEDFRTHAPRCVRFAEVSFERRLYALDNEITATATATSPLALPSDFKRMRSAHIGSDPTNVLTQLGIDDYRAKYADATAAKPIDFAITGSSMLLGPEPDTTYTITLTYIQGLTYISASQQTNWLIETHPDLYYYGSLLHAEAFGWNDERLPLFDSAVDKIIDEIRLADALKRRGDRIGTVAVSYF